MAIPPQSDVQFDCPACLQAQVAPSAYRGRQVKCLHCGDTIVVPIALAKPQQAIPLADEGAGADDDVVDPQLEVLNRIAVEVESINYRIGCLLAITVTLIVLAILGL